MAGRARPALTADRIVEAAVSVADEGGLARVSMRNVARALGVEAMSLYHHIKGKEALLDALADWVFTQVELPAATQGWRAAMEQRAESARRALGAHVWALGLVESRTVPGPALLAHHEAVLACLRANGFSIPMASHAFSAIDAYVYGFVLTETTLPFEAGAAGEFAVEMERMLPAAQYPNLTAMLREQVLGREYDFGDEFGFGLSLILDGLERRLWAGYGPEHLTRGIRGRALL